MRRRFGFTLVEFLLATLLGVLVVVVTLAVFRNVTRNRQMIQDTSELLGQGRYGLNTIRRDLANIHHSIDAGHMRLVGVQRQSVEGRRDRILIRVESGDHARRAETGTGVYEVEYGLVKREGTEEIFLARRSRRIEGEVDHERGGIISYIAGGVSELSFAYYDGEQWQGRWEQPHLPVLVRVELVLSDPEKRVGEIPISQIVSVSHLAVRSFEDKARETDVELLERAVPSRQQP